MKGSKFGFVAVGLMAMIVAVAANNIEKVNANKYEDVTTNNRLAAPILEETGDTPVQQTTEPTVDQATCTHGNQKEVVTKAPTCTKNGMTEMRCVDCDKLMSKIVTKKIGHNYDENDLCSNCGEYATPKFLAKYEVGGVVYQVTNPLSNGWGNVTYVSPVDKAIKKADIPREVEINGIDYQVTKIADKAFAGCNEMTKVTIGKEVKTIGKYAFENCAKLKDVSMGNGVEDIEKGAFKNCNSLKDIEITKNVEEIEDEAFANCINLKKVEIGKSVKKISKKAFYNCTSLKKVEMGKSVKTIEDEAFYNCFKLEEIEIKSAVLKKIGENAFAGIATDAVITLDKDNFNALSVLFTSETGYQETMKLEPKTSIWDYFKNDEDGNVEVETDEVSE
ncbi:MAG: leucine-rich repeat domain-containing protein [Lachnospiraceae bacterium]|nr:leucine-rich repeat domain-containing protein [Lachnospiraceae bacterium]